MTDKFDSNRDWKKYLFASSLTLMMAVGVPNVAKAQETATTDTTQPTDTTVTAPTAETPTPVAETTPETTPSVATTSTTETAVAEQPLMEAAALPVVPVTPTVNAGENYTAEEKTVYMTDNQEIVLPSTLTPEQFAAYDWTFDGKPISEAMQWNLKTGQWDSKNPLVNVAQDGNQIRISINQMFGLNDLSLRWENNVRRTYQDYIGNHQLVGKDASGKTIILPLNYRPYENYMSYEEMIKAVYETEAESATDRYVDVETIGTSTEGRDILQGIVAKSQNDLEQYLTQTVPLMLNDPAKFIEMIKNKEIEYKVPIYFNNTHADEQPGIDIVRKSFDIYAKQGSIKFDTIDKDGNIITKEISIQDILDHAILIFSFAENPDGYANNTRSNSEGFDVNRDTGYQTLPETRAIVEQINKYNPISFMDFHGFVEEFLIEPCTAPHDPNFEYDLLIDNMLGHAHAMGDAGISNSAYDSYLIPYEDWKSGWDDSFSGYTGVYAIYQGILGHTIEVPATNEDSFQAGIHAAMGGIDYVLNNKDNLMLNKLEIFKRGINKEENPATEKHFVDASGNVVGRPKGDNPKFFPDYYVIPMTLDRQKNPQAAFDMIEYFRRNGVVVKELTADKDGYKKGDLVIDMAQAKRGYANHVMYKGANESTFNAMYAELVVNFPDMRGFNAESIFKDGYFNNLLGNITHTQAPRSGVDNSTYYIVKGDTLTATQAINEAIKNGAKIYKSKDGYYVDKANYEQLIKKYALVADGVCGTPEGEVIKPMKVYAPGNPNKSLGFPGKTDSYWAMKDMGFDVVDKFEDADILVLDNGDFVPEDVLGKKPTIILGGEALEVIEESGLLDGLKLGRNGGSYEGLMKAIVDKTNILASGFAENDIFYSNSGTWLIGVPANFRPVVQISDADDFYISGWWPNNEDIKGKVVAVDGKYNGMPVFIYAGNPTNKNHPEYLYQWLANAIFRTEESEFTKKECPKCTDCEIPKDPTPGDGGVADDGAILDDKDQADTGAEIDGVKDGIIKVVEAKSSNAEEVLPQTGESDATLIFGAAALSILSGLGLIHAQRKEEN